MCVRAVRLVDEREESAREESALFRIDTPASFYFLKLLIYFNFIPFTVFVAFKLYRTSYRIS